MGKIIVTHYGGVVEEGKTNSLVFYEGLCQTLAKNGNEVMEIITDRFLVSPWNGTNKLKAEINKQALFSDLIAFGPDLVISFNHSSLEDLFRRLACPVAIWDADHFHHFNDIEIVKKSVQRFIFFCSQTTDIQDCQEILGASEAQCHLMKPATSVKCDRSLPKKYPISFVGTPFQNNLEKEKMHRYRKRYWALARELLKKKADPKVLIKKYKDIPDVEQTVLDFGSVANRTCVLSHVAPLGLNLHGGEGWLDIGLDASLDIFEAYNQDKVYSLDQTQYLYNSSKIGLNINHAQAKSGYSWRVMDIMASSAVLVSNYSKDLAEELGDLSQYVFYQTPQEAYEVCGRLLADDALRERIVRRSNEIVRERHIWDVRIQEIERATKVRLYRTSQIRGQYHLLDSSKYLKVMSPKHILLKFRSSRIIRMGESSIVETIRLLTSSKRINDNFLNDTYLFRFLRFMLPYGFVKGLRYLRHRYKGWIIKN